MSVVRGVKRPSIVIEAAAFCGAAALLIGMARGNLFLGLYTFSHDTIIFFYGVFAYFADGILHGHLPLWNPFSDGGEPLLPAYLQLRILDLVNFPIVWLGGLFTHDLTTLMNWDRMVRALVGALGTYLLLRRWARFPMTRATLALICVLYAPLISGFHQPGIPDIYYLVPWIGIFLFRILEGRGTWGNWLALTFFFGQCLQSYFFVGPVTFVATILLGYLLFRREPLTRVLREPGLVAKLVVCAAFMVAMSLPNIGAVLHQGGYYVSARSLPPSWQTMTPVNGPIQYDNYSSSPSSLLWMPYGIVRLLGTASQPADFLNLLAPSAIFAPNTSEAELFFGGLAFAVALIGLFRARHPLKPIWLTVLTLFAAIMLGRHTLGHWLLFEIFPPLWFIRHTHLMAIFFVLAMLFFFVIGCDRLLAIRQPLFGAWPETWRWLRVCISAWRPLFGAWSETWRWLRVRISARRPRYIVDIGLALVAMAVVYTGLIHRSGEKLVIVGLLLGARLAYLSLPLLVSKGRHTPSTWFARGCVFLIAAVASVVFCKLPAWVHPVPVGNFPWVAIGELVAAVIFVAALRPFGSYGPFAVIGSLAVAGFFVTTHAEWLATWLAAAIVVPGAWILWLRKYRSSWARAAMAVTLFFVTAIELGTMARWESGNWLVDRVDANGSWTVAAGETPFPHTRIAAIQDPPELLGVDDPQIIRYPELLARTAVAFDTPFQYPFDPFKADLDHVVGVRHWEAFTEQYEHRELGGSGLDPSVIGAIFAVDAPIFQFRRDAVVSTDFIAQMRALSPAKAVAALSRTAFLDRATVPPQWQSPKSVTGSVTARVTPATFNFDQASVKIDTDRAGFVYFADAYTPGWQATVNGAPATVFRADGGFKAVQVGAGSSLVAFAYRPMWLIWSLRSYFTAAVLSGLLAFVSAALACWHKARAKRATKHA